MPIVTLFDCVSLHFYYSLNKKEEKQSLFNLHSSRFYTESVASITYMKIAEALENMFTEKYENKTD